ncbi:MFS transporter [Halobacteriovorax marinus]|uniref:MFS transporter n=1 Tax=Halobacteriovorax marinus TaxID=97084 RepID=UPI0012FD6416|nr:MFS transporter [Halobacteriovorax marinus]
MNKNRTKLSIAYLNTLTFSCVQMILYTTIPYIAEQTGVVTANIIGAISIGSLIFSFMGPFWAARSDSLGRKRVLSFGMLGMSLSFILLASLFIFNDTLSLSIKIAMVFASRIIYGLLASAIVPVSQAWQLDLIKETEHIKVLTRNSMCLNLGRILGPILILFKQVNFELIIYAATVWIFTLATSCFLTSDSKGALQGSKSEIKLKEVLANWKLSIKEALYPILLAMIFTSFIGILHTFLGHHLKEVLHIDGKEATILFAKIILVLSILALLVQQLSIWLLKSKWIPRVLIGATSLVTGSIVLMYSKSEQSIWISIFFISFATALIPPVYLSLISNSKKDKTKETVFGKKLGLASVAHSFGYAVGAGLIALSMKLHLVPEKAIVFFVSFTIMALVFILIVKESTPTKTLEVKES